MREYLEWERQATVLPILMCMEAWAEPTRKYFGESWPVTYIKYIGDVVSWYTKMKGLHEFGRRIIEAHMKEGGIDPFLNDVNKIAKKIDLISEELHKTNLSNLDDSKILEQYEKLCGFYIDWFVLGAVCEPVGIIGEHLVREIINDYEKPEYALSLLTTTSRKSFSRRELEDLIKIAIALKNGDNTKRFLEDHAKRWFWLHNNYFKVEVLGREKFDSDIKTILANYPDPKKYLEELEISANQTIKEKEELMGKLNFDKKRRRLIEVLDIHAWYQDYRKEYTMVLLHYLDIILEEIGKREGISLRDMKWLLRDEVRMLFKNFDPTETIASRKQYAFFVWENGEFLALSGEEARKKEEEVLKLIKSAKEIIEIPGNIANKGLVRGIARVTMNPDEAEHLKKGEILVTSMTSPDFITAIKKAAAIITNEGGILCHAAIVSREFGIPCLVGTGIATKAIKDGDFVEVDANHGFVRILKR